MVENEQKDGQGNRLPRHPVLWVFAALGVVVFVAVMLWNLVDADLPLWPGGDDAEPVTSVTVPR